MLLQVGIASTKNTKQTIMKKLYTLFLLAVLSFCGAAQAFADDEHPWAGTYTLMLVDNEPYHYLPDEAAQWITAIPDTFEVTIAWNADANKYLVTKFYNYEVNNLAAGGLDLKVIDDKYAQILLTGTKFHKFTVLPADTVIEQYEDEDGQIVVDTVAYRETVVGLQLTDGTSMMYGTAPIEVKKNSDGQISIGGFKIIYSDRTVNGFFAWTDGATPLNGGDVFESHDFTGFYKVTADMQFAMDDMKWPDTFVMEIATDEWGSYLAQFLGYDVATPNFNAIYVDPDKKNGNNGQITVMNGFNTIVSIDGKTYQLLDGFSADGPIKLSYNEKDGSVTIDYFNVWCVEDQAASSYYLGCTATPISAEEAAAIKKTELTMRKESNAVYNLRGQRISAPTAPGIYIINNKKVVVK